VEAVAARAWVKGIRKGNFRIETCIHGVYREKAVITELSRQSGASVTGAQILTATRELPFYYPALASADWYISVLG